MVILPTTAVIVGPHGAEDRRGFSLDATGGEMVVDMLYKPAADREGIEFGPDAATVTVWFRTMQEAEDFALSLADRRNRAF